ncbi:MAG: hypothetical protein LBB51_01510 [Zoogloeaceae bacterium]|jgi:uncharacterized membrane protein YvbJ|nr:hypothetical protein [Zoogloeaceae bacterium]
MLSCPRCQTDLGEIAPIQCPACGLNLSASLGSASVEVEAAREERHQSRIMLWTLLFFGCVGIALALSGLLWALEQKPPRLTDVTHTETAGQTGSGEIVVPPKP